MRDRVKAQFKELGQGLQNTGNNPSAKYAEKLCRVLAIPK